MASDHAKLRWLQRAGVSNLTAGEAWREGYFVGVPSHAGTARLHPPTKTLLLEHSGQLTTVLDASLMDYNADHLTQCGECSLAFQPVDDNQDCEWCHEPHGATTND